MTQKTPFFIDTNNRYGVRLKEIATGKKNKEELFRMDKK